MVEGEPLVTKKIHLRVPMLWFLFSIPEDLRFQSSFGIDSERGFFQYQPPNCTDLPSGERESNSLNDAFFRQFGCGRTQRDDGIRIGSRLLEPESWARKNSRTWCSAEHYRNRGAPG